MKSVWKTTVQLFNLEIVAKVHTNNVRDVYYMEIDFPLPQKKAQMNHVVVCA